jgi:hypothetical protein
MTLIVCTAGNKEETDAIERMLQQICGGVVVDRRTDLVQMTPYDYRSEGCRCLRALIESNHTVHIHPLPSPAAEVPGSDTGPDNPKKTIGSCRGGATVPSSVGDASAKADGSPGPGSDVEVFIDTSNNNKQGYPAPAGSGDRKPELWLILAHELTGGHAYHCITGTLPHTTGEKEQDEANRENQAIESENIIRRQHGWHRRPLRRAGESQW